MVLAVDFNHSEALGSSAHKVGQSTPLSRRYPSRGYPGLDHAFFYPYGPNLEKLWPSLRQSSLHLPWAFTVTARSLGVTVNSAHGVPGYRIKALGEPAQIRDLTTGEPHHPPWGLSLQAVAHGPRDWGQSYGIVRVVRLARSTSRSSGSSASSTGWPCPTATTPTYPCRRSAECRPVAVSGWRTV